MYINKTNCPRKPPSIFVFTMRGTNEVRGNNVNDSVFINKVGSIQESYNTFMEDCRLWHKPIKVLR